MAGTHEEPQPWQHIKSNTAMRPATWPSQLYGRGPLHRARGCCALCCCQLQQTSHYHQLLSLLPILVSSQDAECWSSKKLLLVLNRLPNFSSCACAVGMCTVVAALPGSTLSALAASYCLTAAMPANDQLLALSPHGVQLVCVKWTAFVRDGRPCVTKV